MWPLPLRDQPWNDHRAAVAARAAETPLIDTVIECGDVLYLPRGYVHSATSLGDVSGHLTVGIHPITCQTIADHVLAALADDVEMRRSLPAGVDLSDDAVLDGELTAVLVALRAAIDRVDRRAVARGIGRHLSATTRPAPLRPLEQLAVAAQLMPDASVVLRPGLRVALRNDGRSVVVELPDKKVRFPEAAGEAVRIATSGAVVTARSLPRVDAAEGVALLSQLLRDGILVPA